MEMPHPEYAGFWKRFVACMIDGILICIVSGVLFIPFLAFIGLGVFSMHDADFFYDSESAVVLPFRHVDQLGIV